ncbi:ABC transporter permease subunit [Paenibacillus sacheonensis]|uniref:ABC transporter permease subunit n=1 Tax=Paenibacillus sacheonensis TaxID=742054 RepID=A0A7X4YSI4_9BACL|nr:ABC transporter permease subunit [Paenibacillus sacheonensis]MBM7569232.1 putative aldouronate transport system permease protein [Paenibacillus sacheonensis]NBC71757.1 ABC transporter permease subunit [Paenibacillus sacheonensis]
MKRAFPFLRGKNGELSLLFLPGFLFFLVMSYVPMVGIVIAFKDYNLRKGIFGSEWVGFDNLKFFFISDTAWRVTRNTILYSLGYIFVTLIVSLALAILLNELTKRWIKVHQTIMFLPYFLSWVLVSYITNAFLDHQNGFLNAVLAGFGLEKIEWYFGAQYWPFILNIVHLWKAVGFSVLLYYAGIMGIDQSYYEAARIDGANKAQMARSITIPLLTPLITILLILSIGGMFRGDFGLHYFIPNNTGLIYSSTDIIDTYVFRALRTLGDISMSAAVGLFQSIVGLVLVLLSNLLVRKINDENSLW